MAEFNEVMTKALNRNKELEDRDTPKKVIEIGSLCIKCPACELDLLGIETFCSNCGQRLQW